MRIQIINTNRERSPQTLIPLGACCVASAAELAGHEVHFTDLCFSRRPVPDTQSAVRAIGPDVIGLSIRNLDNCDYAAPRSYLPEIELIVDACRKNSGAEIVLGGAAVSEAPAQVARRLGCRLAVAGEGELSFPSLLESIQRGDDPHDVPGVASADQSAAVHPVRAADLASLPDPQPARWLDLRRYAAYDASLPVQTKRGCALSCSYCCYPLLEGHAWRLRDPQWVSEQVSTARKIGLRGAEFIDSVFGLPQGHAIACCEAVTRTVGSGSPLPLTTLEFNPLASSPELVDAMNAAGFSAVGITAESGSDTMLSSLGKGFTTDDLSRARDKLRGLRAKKMWIFMLGGPGETEKTVRETVDFIESLPHSDLVLVTHGIRILPQTALRQELVDEGYIDADDDLVEPTFYYSPHIAPERASQILAESSFPQSNMVTLTDCGHPLAPALQRLATAFGMQPPYWRGLPAINRARRLLRL
jgi:anaerobic magnesium-protoporphyrin IX monomethyl ester cyclase